MHVKELGHQVKINLDMQYHVIKNATKQASGVQPGWGRVGLGGGLWDPAT